MIFSAYDLFVMVWFLMFKVWPSLLHSSHCSQALCPCQSKMSISHRAGCGQKRSPGQLVTQGTHKIFQCTSYLHKRSLVWHCMSFLMLGMSTGYNLISRIQKKNQKISVFLDAFFFFFFHIPRSASNSLFLRSQERKKDKKKKKDL